MTKFQFFNLIKGLQFAALCDNFLLENALDGGTIHTVFDLNAKVDKSVVPGSYIWIWADDNGDAQYIDELINDTLHIESDVVAEWIGWSGNAEPRKHYILLVDKSIK